MYLGVRICSQVDHSTDHIKLTIENYLHGVISLAHEMPRLATRNIINACMSAAN